MAKDTKEDYSFHDDVLERGTLFAVGLYFLVTAFGLSIIVGLFQGATEGDILAFGYALFFGGAAAYSFKRHDIYSLLLVSLFPVYAIILVLSFQGLPALITAAGPLGSYLAVSVGALLIGAGPAYLFKDVSPGILHYLTVSIYGSSIIAILSSMLAALTEVFQTIRLASRAPQILFNRSETLVAVSEIIDPLLVFALALVMFNAPFIVYARRREDFDPKLLSLYLAPVLLYALVRISMSSILGVTAP